MSLRDMTPAELEACEEVEAAERALEAARLRFGAVRRQAERVHRRHLALVRPSLEGQAEPGSVRPDQSDSQVEAGRT
jgi:hypothetical protein